MRFLAPIAAAFALVALPAPDPLGAQTVEIPAGYTAYLIEGPGINAPPLPFRIEGERLVTPEGGIVGVTESRIGTERATFTLETPDGPAKFVGRRVGDAFAGFLFIVEEGNRDAVALTITPAGTERPEVRYAEYASAPGVSRIEVVPGGITIEAGEARRFVARVYDETGAERPDPAVEWYSDGSRTRMNADGEFTGLGPGEVRIVAVVDGAIGTTTITVAEPRISGITLFTVIPARLAVDSRVPLEYHALSSVHRWSLDPAIRITSSDPTVLEVDGDEIVARAPGRATLTLAADDARETREVEVVAAAGRMSIQGTPADPVRTGDVVRLSTTVAGARPTWAVVEPGAEIYADGAFVAERPGTYTVIATLGDRLDRVRIEAVRRHSGGRIHIVGHGPNTESYTSDLWPQNQYVYVGTHQANRLLTYDVSDPAAPVLTDTQEFDARVVNDVKVNEAGTLLVATREGAADRRNGILVFTLEDPAHPRLVSEYTETLTAGVHNVFWVDDLVYAVNDGTGDMHIIDVSDPAAPSEAGRWGIPVAGRSLHDVWVQDGIAYLSYLGDGLVILDVGGAGSGGTPSAPVQISRIFYPGGPTHTAMRHRDYVFVGDEDFSLQGTVPATTGSDPRGPIHVIDVSDVTRPRYVARYEVPEAGAHNIWISHDVLYIGYYQGGIRVVDISGELKGDLYAQGREVAYYLPTAGPDEAMKPYDPRVWGVFPMFGNGWVPQGEALFATDYNSGLWLFTVEMPEEERPIS